MMDVTRLSTEFLSVREAAAIAKVRTATVRRWIRRGFLRAAKVGRKLWRVRLDDFEALLGGRRD